ncbi:MAG: hypothetical protein COB37_10355 [Kordiimonadales bacterium]|nr:MAG: hypothetical protein COB37_10355 [Kordiimonadales bacterium]
MGNLHLRLEARARVPRVLYSVNVLQRKFGLLRKALKLESATKWVFEEHDVLFASLVVKTVGGLSDGFLSSAFSLPVDPAAERFVVNSLSVYKTGV